MTQMGQVFRASPPKPPVWHYPAIALMSAMVPGFFYVLAFVIVAELMTGFQVAQQTRSVLAITGCVMGMVTMALFLAWEQERWHWELTGTELRCGRRRRRRVYPLRDLVRLSDGIPDIALPGKRIVDALNPALSSVLAQGRAGAFLLIFRDGTMVPLNLHACTGGKALMEALKNLAGDRVCRQCNLSPSQARALRLADWNRPVTPVA